MTQENIEHLGILEQNLSSVVAQRQTIQNQILEMNHAVAELKGASEAYEIVGTVMVKKPADELGKSLNEKKEMLSIKLTSVQKQESLLREEQKKLQDSVMAELKGSE